MFYPPNITLHFYLPGSVRKESKSDLCYFFILSYFSLLRRDLKDSGAQLKSCSMRVGYFSLKVRRKVLKSVY